MSPSGRDVSLAGAALVVVGHATRDLVEDDARGWRLGGSVTFVSLAAGRMGLPVHSVLGVDALSAKADELDLLADAGVEIERVRLPSAPVFRNTETPRGRRQECLATGRPLRPRDIPTAWRGALAWAFVPVLAEVGGAAWAALPPRDAIVGVGWQGFLREARAGGLTTRRLPEPDAIIARADVTVVSIEDFGPPRAPWESPAAPVRLEGLTWRPGQQLLITAAAHGGRLFTRSPDGWTALHYGAMHIPDVVDPTGAGDVFLAAFMASAVDPSLPGHGATPDQAQDERIRGDRARGDGLADRLRFAAVAAALSIEGPGITAIPTRAEVLARLAQPGG